jgi:hypothetical protein
MVAISIGACRWIICAARLPIPWFAMKASSIVDLPPYMLPG